MKTSDLTVFCRLFPSVQCVHEDTLRRGHRKHPAAEELRSVPQHQGQEQRFAGVQRAAVSGHRTVRSGGREPRHLDNRRPSKTPGHEGPLLRVGRGGGK